ncbi:MAG: universal stress protein [Myxococcales bacterium]|nr:universal stress protein [Myxococcales bacterium]
MSSQKLILATDLSAESESAFAPAAELCRALDAELTLLYVNELTSYELTQSDRVSDYLSEVRKWSDRRLAEQTSSLKALGVAVTPVEIAGVPSSEIIRYVEANPADVVIISRHGQRGASHSVMGSTVKRLLRQIHVPVLVVPVGEGAAPFTRFGRVLASTDFSEESNRGLREAVEFAKRMKVPMSVVNIVKAPVPLVIVPGEPPLYVPRETIDSAKESREAELQSIVRRIAGDTDVRGIIGIEADAARGILEAAEEEGANLVVIPTHGHGAVAATLLGSTSERVVKFSKVPVLVVPKAYLDA